MLGSFGISGTDSVLLGVLGSSLLSRLFSAVCFFLLR